MDRTLNASFTIRTTLDAAVVDATNSIAVIGNHGTNQCPARKFKILTLKQSICFFCHGQDSYLATQKLPFCCDAERVKTPSTVTHVI